MGCFGLWSSLAFYLSGITLSLNFYVLSSMLSRDCLDESTSEYDTYYRVGFDDDACDLE